MLPVGGILKTPTSKKKSTTPRGGSNVKIQVFNALIDNLPFTKKDGKPINEAAYETVSNLTKMYEDLVMDYDKLSGSVGSAVGSHAVNSTSDESLKQVLDALKLLTVVPRSGLGSNSGTRLATGRFLFKTEKIWF